MSKVYVWHSVQDCLPSAVTVEDGVEWHGQENNEVLHLLGKAMCSGELKVYDIQGRLQPPPKDVGLTQYLYPAEVNKWFKANDLPYEWNPEKIDRALTLEQRKDKGELKLASIQAAKYLKSTGTVEKKITLETVAVEIAKQIDWDYSSESIKPLIRASWWKESIR